MFDTFFLLCATKGKPEKESIFQRRLHIMPKIKQCTDQNINNRTKTNFSFPINYQFLDDHFRNNKTVIYFRNISK